MIMLKILGCLFLIFILCVFLTWICTLFIDTNIIYYEDSLFYRMILYAWTGFAIKILGLKVKVTGLDKIPDGRIVLVQNHRSNFDPIITWYALRKKNLAFISKEENFNIPLFGRIIHRCCFRAIDRENPRNAIKTVFDCVDLIAKDRVSIGVYPEGTRNKNSGSIVLLPFHNGVFKVAQKSNAPIVVTTIKGTEKIYKNVPFLGTEIELDVLEVINPEQLAGKRSDEIGSEVEKIMTENLISNHQEYIKSDLRTRIITGAFMTALLVIVLRFSGIPSTLKYACGILSVIAEFELLRTFKNRISDAIAITIFAAYSIAIIILDLSNFELSLAISFFIYVLCAVIMLLNIDWFKEKRFAFRLLIACMLPLPFKTIICVRALPEGLLLLIIVICISTFTDIFGYLVGKKWGKTKMAVKISPNKTSEGSMGGTIAAFVISYIVVIVGIKPVGSTANLLWCALIITASCLSQIGDLIMSAVKRIVGIKDFGRILPGHGGILDRLDSILMILPYYYLWLISFGHIMIN